MNEPVQQPTLFFFVPVIVAYLAACGGWLALTYWRPVTWAPRRRLETERAYLDFGLALLGAVGILLIGQGYRSGLLLPRGEIAWINQLAWTLDNIIIFSPIALVLGFRRQGPHTVYLSPDHIVWKLGYGVGLGVLSVLLFLLLRGEPGRAMAVFAGAFEIERLVNFFPVFMEGVAVAFLFVRIRWAFGLWPALLLPALLFAAAHVPGSLEAGRSAFHIGSFFALNSTLVVVILYTVQRSRDIIWIGIVHYLMDIAIDAF